MSDLAMDAIRSDVERAIHEKLHVRVQAETWRECLRTPEAIVGEHIIMQDSDCGLVKPRMRWTVWEWIERTRFGSEHRNLWRRTGFWDFTLAAERDWQEIEYANRHPNEAGRELAQLRREAVILARYAAILKAQRDKARCQADRAADLRTQAESVCGPGSREDSADLRRIENMFEAVGADLFEALERLRGRGA